jgi:hypothetical protein
MTFMERLNEMNKKYSKLILIFTILVLLSTSLLFNHSNSNNSNNPQVNDIVTAANNLLNSFNKDQLERIKFDFNDDERFNWAYVPTSREGIPIKEFNDKQKELLNELLNISLSKQGVKKVEGVLILESVLYELSGQSSFRDPGKYFVTFFGTPDKTKPWGWRFEGHHLSLNFTIVKDSVIVSTPIFYGANPSEVKQGKHKGLRVLKFEEDYARELIKSLNKHQFKEALIEEDAPSDIITSNDERVDPLNPKGISASKLKKEQLEILLKLIREYIANSNPNQAEQRNFDFMTSNKNEIYFAWAGGIERGQHHYYRIQCDTFLIEYDNTQDNANHIHFVWRSFKNDFGEDLLKKHYKEYKH